MKIMQWRTFGALLSTTMLLGIVAHVHGQEPAQNLRGFKDPNQGLGLPSVTRRTVWKMVDYAASIGPVGLPVLFLTRGGVNVDWTN
jgi:hypothetical protein